MVSNYKSYRAEFNIAKIVLYVFGFMAIIYVGQLLINNKILLYTLFLLSAWLLINKFSK